MTFLLLAATLRNLETVDASTKIIIFDNSFLFLFDHLNQKERVFFQKYESTFINSCLSSKWDQILYVATIFEIHAEIHFHLELHTVGKLCKGVLYIDFPPSDIF